MVTNYEIRSGEIQLLRGDIPIEKFLIVCTSVNMLSTGEPEDVSESWSESTFSVSLTDPISLSSVQCIGQIVSRVLPRVQIGQLPTGLETQLAAALLQSVTLPLPNFRAVPTWTEKESESLALLHFATHISQPSSDEIVQTKQSLMTAENLEFFRTEIGSKIESNFHVALLFASMRSMGLKKTLRSSLRRVLEKSQSYSQMAKSNNFDDQIKSLIQNARNKGQISSGVLSGKSGLIASNEQRTQTLRLEVDRFLSAGAAYRGQPMRFTISDL